jgi:putative MATE family efflux protein
MRLFARPTREEILTGHPIGMMIRIGAPAVVSSILFTLYNLADAFWIGHLPGEQSLSVLAGIQSSWPFVWFLISLIGGFGGAAVSALVAQNIGANRTEDANHALNQLFTVGVLSGFVLGITGYLIAPTVISYLVADPSVAREATSYLRIIFLGLHTMLLPGLISFAFQATGDTLTPLVVNLIGIGLNMILDPILILGWNPLRILGLHGALAQASPPQMGIVGAAIATIIAQGAAMLIFLALFLKGRGPLRLNRSSLHPEWKWMKKALRIGLPAGFGQSSVAFGFMIMTAVIGRLDNAAAALAGYGVADRIFGLLFIATDGLGVGLTTMIGQALGADLMDRARELVRRGIVALFAIVVVEAAFLYFARIPLVKWFMPGQAEAVHEGARFIQLFAAGMPFLSAFFAAQAIYRGAGHNMPAMILGIIRLWVLRIPLSWAFAFLLHMGSDGVWLGMSLSNVVSGLASLAWLSTRSWQRSVLEPMEEELESEQST